ncbi:MAG: monovalent cation/H+ antiporter complex subunit F [Microbacterium sp.]
MSWLLVPIYLSFGIAALLTVWRIVIGPSILDRAVAADVLLTLVLCALGAEMAVNHHTRTLPVLLIVASVGVFGSISVARFVARRDQVAPQDQGEAQEGPRR